MRIYSMTATFGKLEHETLQLKPGLNVIEAPNEWGKSTWCAFLVAMLYGMETRAHSTKSSLADKERYAPWSGSPMSGQIALHWQGKDITIQRRTKGRIPMGEFLAFETNTGLPIPQLTAENCGQVLLGVEKPVFLRSGFLKGSDLLVEQEESLRRRLTALVTTGDENAMADDLEQKLKDLKNRCRANRTNGLLPQAYGRRTELEQDLKTLQILQRQCHSIREQVSHLEARRSQLELHRKALDYRDWEDAQQKFRHAAAAREEAARAEALCQKAVSHLPPPEQLQEKWDALSALEQKRHLLEQSLEQTPPPPPAKQPPLPENCVVQAAADARSFSGLRIFMILLLIAAAVVGCLGIAAWAAHNTPVSYAMWGLGVVFLAVGICLLFTAGRLAKQYAGLPHKLWVSHTAHLLREQTHQQTLANHTAQLQSQLQDVNRRISVLAGSSSHRCLAELQQGLNAYAQLDSAQRNLERATHLEAALHPGDISLAAPEQEDRLSYTRPETERLLSQCCMELQQLQLRLGTCQGQMDALGQQAALEQELDNLNRRIEQLEDTYAALELALASLAQARADLQRRFAPQIVKKTQAFFSQLTDGRYDQLSMEENLRLHIRAQGENTLRPSIWRSEGTVDQLYLALRLAVAAELIPQAPLVLDDVFVRFDDLRLGLAMDVLKKEAQNRQIILFTCHNRENTACNTGISDV